MPAILSALLSGALLGLVSLPHCAAMCGPLSAAACSRSARRAAPLHYQLGRTLGYAFAGGVAGQVGSVFRLVAPSLPAMLIFGTLASAACLWVAYGLLPKRAPLVQLTAAPRGRSLAGTLLQLVPENPAVLGAFSALLPCGALAAALLSAVATASATLGASVMLGFVTTSGFALLGASVLARVLPTYATPRLRQIAAGALVIAACLLIARPIRAWIEVAQNPAAARHLHCH